MRQDRFDCGWNDLANGILTWIPHVEWATPLEWAIHCRQIAIECMADTGDDGYYQGAIACADEYERAGVIHKKGQ
jgi:hypothetical protein